jgi:CcmD family protein
MDAITLLALANAAVWLCLGAYLAFLGMEQRNISARLNRWELLHSENQIQRTTE